MSVTRQTEIVKHPHPRMFVSQSPFMINIMPVPAIANTQSEANNAPNIQQVHFHIFVAISISN